MTDSAQRPLALVTGASSGIGFELRRGLFRIEGGVGEFRSVVARECQGSGVSVTLLLPGATATEFFKRALSTHIKGAQGPMDSAAEVARTGYEALMREDSDVIVGEHNRKAMREARQNSEAENARGVADVLHPI